MALDKKQIALTVGGIMAGLTLTYLLYRVEQQNSATNEANQSAITQSELANQQAQIASLPSINVPMISSVPSSTDTSNQSQASAIDPNLEAILANVLSQDNSPVTSQSTPIASITALPLPTGTQIPPVVVPQLENFQQTQPTGQSNNSGYSNTVSWNGLRTNLAKGASLGV